MNSYNSIKKIAYNSLNEKEPVSLVEYIEFKDDRNQQKYAVLKFKNKITQRLFKISFTVYSYGQNDVLLEKNVITYSSLKVNENQTFVPNAKLKLDYNTVRITCELDYAKFETCEYKDGEFNHVQYTFDQYIENQKQDKEQSKDEQLKPKTVSKLAAKQNKINSKQEAKDKAHGYYFKDITEANRTKKPLVITLVCALLIAIFTFITVANISSSATWFTIGDFDYVLNGDTLSIKKYHGNDTNVVIPAVVKQRKVVRVLDSAFENNKKIQTLTFESKDKKGNTYDHSIYLNERAFAFCPNLRRVDGNELKIKASTYSFAKCTQLTDFIAPYAVLSYDCFYGNTNLMNIKVNDIATHRLVEIFDSHASDQDNTYYKNNMYVQLYYLNQKPRDTFLGKYNYKVSLNYHYEH